jgi:hypothetical protein
VDFILDLLAIFFEFSLPVTFFGDGLELLLIAFNDRRMFFLVDRGGFCSFSPTIFNKLNISAHA